MRNRLGNKELEDSLNRIQEWIRGADQKISIYLAFVGIFLTIVLPSFFSYFSTNFFNLPVLTQVLFIEAIFLQTYSILKSILALAPVLEKKKYNHSVLFFGDIASKKVSVFKGLIDRLTTAEYREDLLDQIYISAKIATKKHTYFKDSLWLFVVGIVLFALGYLYMFRRLIYAY